MDTRIDVYAYLVITSSDVLLIDTGVGEGNDLIDKRFEPRRTPIDVELGRFGIEIADVSLVVNSHLHYDHCGNNRLFPHAEIFVQEKELAIARTKAYTVLNWFDYDGVRMAPVCGDTEISAGVKLISSPGHTPGHQSILVETSSSTILIAAQAAYTAAEYLRGGDAADQAHKDFEGHYLESISRLKSFGADVVYFSHDIKTVKQTGHHQ